MGKNMKCDHYCAEQPSEPACTPQRPSSRHQNAERNTGCTSAEQKETWETFCACFLSVSEEENAFDILKPHQKNLASFFGLQQSDHQPGWQHPAARGGEKCASPVGADVESQSHPRHADALLRVRRLLHITV